MADYDAVTLPIMDHVSIVVADLEASRAFYTAALAPLGLVEVGRDAAGGTGFGTATGRDDFWIGSCLDGPPSRGVHVAFTAVSREQVQAFHAAALAAGGTERLAPGVQLQYSDRYYGAFVNDLDGNNIEAVFHSPEPIVD